MKKIVIYGAGGFGKEIACLIKSINEEKLTWELIGFIEDGLEVGFENRYGQVLGGLSFLNSYKGELAVAISIANPKIIEKLSSQINNSQVYFPNLIAPNTNFFDSEAFKIGIGNVIFFGCRFSCDVEIGDFNLFNGQVAIGHDVCIGNYNVLGPSTRISGNTIIGNTNFFGLQSIILQGLKIGNYTRIGVNSTIIKNTENGFLYYGNPAKRLSL
jgi:sugar O-acyltransferase (sialic acid O-acetyltransferase NeuD family)